MGRIAATWLCALAALLAGAASPAAAHVRVTHAGGL